MSFFSVKKLLLESQNNAFSYTNPWKSLVVFIQQLKGDYSCHGAQHPGPVPSPARTRSLKATLFPIAVNASLGTRRVVKMGEGSFCQGVRFKKKIIKKKTKKKGWGKEC